MEIEKEKENIKEMKEKLKNIEILRHQIRNRYNKNIIIKKLIQEEEEEENYEKKIENIIINLIKYEIPSKLFSEILLFCIPEFKGFIPSKLYLFF
jgi:hypothetical protein